MNAYEGLLNQVEEFIRRFYLNRLIRGVMLFVGITLLLFLIVANLEYFGSFNSAVRTTLFFLLVFSFSGLGWFYLIDPLLKLNKIGKRMNAEEAALLIGKLIPDIDDKIINTLQLSERKSDTGNTEMLEAAIRQKSVQLSRFSFGAAIDFKENRKFLRYVIPVLLVFVSVLIFQPQIIVQSSERIVNYDKEFIPPAPFSFVLADLSKEVEEGEDVVLHVVTKGEELPEKVFLNSNYGRFLMRKVSGNSFEYTLPKVKEDVTFHFDANGYRSSNYQVDVFGSSKLSNFKALIEYPTYLGKENETITNPVVLTVPEGAKIRFTGQMDNVVSTEVRFADSVYSFSEAIDFSRSFMNSESFTVLLENQFGGDDKEISKQVDVIKDAFPSIEVSETKDSLSELLRFFEGTVKDDYGISRVTFVSQVKGENSVVRVSIPGVSFTGGRFFHMLDLRNIGLEAGEELSYYFEVYDNDGVNGPKRSRSNTFIYKVPTKDELKEKRKEAYSNAQSGMSELQKEMKEFEKNMESFRKANLDKKMDSWKKKDMLDQLMEQQETLKNSVEKAKEELEKTIEEKELFDEVDEELLEKQKLLEEMLDKLLDDEMKELLKELQELMDKNDMNGVEEKMEDMELTKEEMNRQMDRTMEMLKKMEVEEAMKDFLSNLEELQEKQEELSKEQGGGEQEEQEELKEEFEQLLDDLEEIKEKNEDLKRPFDIDEEKELQEGASDDMQKASDKLEKNKGEKANEDQKNASDKMKEMKESIQAQMEAQKQQQQGEDMEALRALLENLMRLSFDQEAIMNELSALSAEDPKVTKLNHRQRKLMDDHVVVKDSLVALAERVPQVAGIIDTELKSIDRNFMDITPLMHDRLLNELMIKQQFAMTGYNNLALLLNESLEQMQQQMQSMMKGSGQCENPGGSGGKPSEGMSMGDMKEMLKEQLQKMKGKGSNPGGEEPGQQPGNQPGGQGGMGLPGMSSKEVAKMAAEQAAMRKMLEKLRQELNKDGKGSGNALNPLIEELERQEKDLVNRRDKFVVERQQEILTRLLESEKALQEREWEEKRESETAKNQENRNLIQFAEYKKRKEREIEMLRLKTPGLNNYYKRKAAEYFNKVLLDDK